MRRLEASGVIFAHIGRYPLLNFVQPTPFFKYLESGLILDGPINFQSFQIFGEKLQVTIH